MSYQITLSFNPLWLTLLFFNIILLIVTIKGRRKCNKELYLVGLYGCLMLLLYSIIKTFE